MGSVSFKPLSHVARALKYARPASQVAHVSRGVQQLESRRRTWARKLRQREEEALQGSARGLNIGSQEKGRPWRPFIPCRILVLGPSCIQSGTLPEALAGVAHPTFKAARKD